MKKIRRAYAKLLKRLRRYRDVVVSEAPCSWDEMRRVYLQESFDSSYWTDEQRALIQPEIRAILIALMVSGKVTDEEFILLAARFLQLRKTAEIAIFNNYARKQGIPSDLLKLLADGSIEFSATTVAELN